jgi:hypothetical protein
MIDTGKIYRIFTIFIGLIIVFQLLSLVFLIYQKGTNYTPVKLLSNAYFPKKVGEKVFYYTGDHFASIDPKTGKTNNVTSVNYIPDVTGVLWLKDGIIFSATSGDPNSDIGESSGTWFVGYDSESERIPLDVSPVTDAYDTETVSGFIGNDGTVYYFNNKDYTQSGAIRLSENERFINSEGNLIWTYTSSDGSFKSYSATDGVEKSSNTYLPDKNIEPLYISSNLILYRQSFNSGELFDIHSYNTKDKSDKILLKRVSGPVFSNTNPLFVSTRASVLELQIIKNGKATTSGYIDDPGLDIPSRVDTYEDGFLYCTYQNSLYLLTGDNSETGKISPQAIGIEKYSKSDSISLNRLITTGNTDTYEVYYNSDFNSARAETIKLFESKEYDINKYSLRYIKVNER